MTIFSCGCEMLDRRFIYYPHKWQAGDWARISGLPIQDVWFEAEDGIKLHGWFVEARPSKAVMLWCHGNAGNIIHRLENIAELYKRGLSVFIFDYRGYGQSKGKPSEQGLYKDALAAYDWLAKTQGVEQKRIVIFGRSLGASVAAELATKRGVAGLILETPFPSVRAVVRKYYGPIPFHWLLRGKFPLDKTLPKIHLPVLVIHGDRDHVISVSLGRKVFELANSPKDFYLIHGSDHNDTYIVGGEPYFARLFSFINQVVSS